MAKKETQPCIVIVDLDRKKHVFTGNVRFWHEGAVCRVWNTTSNITLASFSNPISVLIEEK